MIGIIVSGSPHSWLDVNSFKKQEALIIGVDRGALDLLNQGIVPSVAIGDFDSISETDFEFVVKHCSTVIKLNAEKDETDTEVAILHGISLGLTEMYIYGGLGGRIDHTIANVRLLLKFVKERIKLTLIDEKSRLTILAPGSYEFESVHEAYLSFFALENVVADLTLTGVKYPLTNYALQQDDIRCISNEVVASSFTVKFSQGYLLMIYSRD